MSAKSTRQAKVDWLLAHSSWWQGWPRGAHGGDARLWEIVDAMKKEGLIAQCTHPADIHMQSLINEARKQRREGKHNGR